MSNLFSDLQINNEAKIITGDSYFTNMLSLYSSNMWLMRMLVEGGTKCEVDCGWKPQYKGLHYLGK